MISEVFYDVTNTCNLRCPFCIYDYGELKKGLFTSEETFLKVMQLAAAVERGRLSLSCLHEPTMHPRFGHLLRIIPRDIKDRVFFTTNLAIVLKDQLILDFRSSGVNHINVSLDTLSPSLYSLLRVRGKLENVIQNLERLTECFGYNADAPRVHFITIGFKSNLNEIRDLVTICNKKFRSAQHEIRFLYDEDHISFRFKRENLLDDQDWDKIESEVADLSYVKVFRAPREMNYRISEKDPAIGTLDQRSSAEARVPTKPLSLFVNSEGFVTIGDMRENNFKVNINCIGDPFRFFNAIAK